MTGKLPALLVSNQLTMLAAGRGRTGPGGNRAEKARRRWTSSSAAPRAVSRSSSSKLTSPAPSRAAGVRRRGRFRRALAAPGRRGGGSGAADRGGPARRARHPGPRAPRDQPVRPAGRGDPRLQRSRAHRHDPLRRVHGEGTQGAGDGRRWRDRCLDQQPGPVFQWFTPIIDAINFPGLRILRMKMNFNFPQLGANEFTHGIPHVDLPMEDHYTTAVYYVTDGDGDTLLFNEKNGHKGLLTIKEKIKPKKGRKTAKNDKPKTPRKYNKKQK